MSRRLISRSQDLQRLLEEGYDIEIRSGYLLVKSVPYVNSRKEVALGTLISPLSMAGDVTTKPGDHVVLFVGEYPCRADGSPIESIRHASGRQTLDQGLVIDHRFSNKPASGYSDYYEKMTTYIRIISGPAEALDPNTTPKVNRFTEAPDDAVFAYMDTASSTAGIAAASRKLEAGNIAIVGLGGTGSYVLDFVAKTPVKGIHLFDGDTFLQHNAFRSPGAPSCDELRAKPLKVDYLAQRYSNMRRGIVAHGEYIDGPNVGHLQGMDFVFLCLDRGYAKREIVEQLLAWRTPFIDVGMGIELSDDALAGILRVTTVTAQKCDHLHRIPFSDADPNADYSQSIQVADLNALNAALAVMKWKKLCGFYRDLRKEHFATLTLDTQILIPEEEA